MNLPSPGVVRVEEIPAEFTHDLRRRILRGSRPDAVVGFPEDDRPAAFHLAVRRDDTTLAVASFSVEETPYRPGSSAVRLRGMAVDGPFQRQGLGRLLVTTVVDRLRADGVDVLWCNARDSAIGFYARLGFGVVGDGFVLAESGIAHHVMVLDL